VTTEETLYEYHEIKSSTSQESGNYQLPTPLRWIPYQMVEFTLCSQCEKEKKKESGELPRKDSPQRHNHKSRPAKRPFRQVVHFPQILLLTPELVLHTFAVRVTHYLQSSDTYGLAALGGSPQYLPLQAYFEQQATQHD